MCAAPAASGLRQDEGMSQDPSSQPSSGHPPAQPLPMRPPQPPPSGEHERMPQPHPPSWGQPPRQQPRIPAPLPEPASAAPRGRTERRRRRDPETQVPGWWGDARRMLMYAIMSAAFWALALLLARTGLLSHSGRAVSGDAVLAGILAAMPGLVFPFLQFASGRADRGFRTHRLVPLMWFSLGAGALVQTLSILVWPLILGDRAVPGTVLGELPGGTAVLTVFAFVLASMAWFTALVMVMILWAPVGALIALLPFLGAIVLFGFAGAGVFGAAPAGAQAGLWGAAAAAGLAAVTLVSALRVRRHRRAQISAPQRPTLEELRRHPR